MRRISTGKLSDSLVNSFNKTIMKPLFRNEVQRNFANFGQEKIRGERGKLGAFAGICEFH